MATDNLTPNSESANPAYLFVSLEDDYTEVITDPQVIRYLQKYGRPDSFELRPIEPPQPTPAALTVYGYKIGDGVQHKRLNSNAMIVEFRTKAPGGVATSIDIKQTPENIYAVVKDVHGDILGWDFHDLADYPRKPAPAAPAVKLTAAQRKALEYLATVPAAYLSSKTGQGRYTKFVHRKAAEHLITLGYVRRLGTDDRVVITPAGRVALTEAK